MVHKYYMFLILFLSVLFVFAYDTSSELKIRKKLELTNEVIYRIPSSISLNKDETPQIDINSKYETSTTTDFSTIDTAASESESTTSDEKYSSLIKDENSQKDINDTPTTTDFTTTTDKTKSGPESTKSDENYTPSIKERFSQRDIKITYETSTTTDFSTINDETKTESETTTSEEKYVSSIKDETSRRDIYLKYDTTTTDFTTIDKRKSVPVSATSDEKYIPSIKDEFSQRDFNFKSTTTDLSTTIDETKSESESTTSEGKYTLPIKDEFSQRGIDFKYETSITANFPATIDITTSESESTTSSEEYTMSTEQNELLLKAMIDKNTDSDVSTPYTLESTSTEITEFSSTITTDSTETTTINVCETAEIPQINIFPSPFSLNITWTNSVNDENCKFLYDIQSSEDVFYNITSDTFTIFYALNACSHYSGAISILYNNKTIHSKNFSVVTLQAVDPVEQLQMQIIEENFEISWLPSERTKSCINYYKWKYFQDEIPVKENIVRSTNVRIPQPDDCFKHLFIIYAVINDYFESPAQNKTYTDIKVNDPPKFESVNMSATSATTIWKYKKICKPQSFLLKFISDDKENDTIANIHLEKDNKIIAEVDGLLAFTNYSFQGAIKNEKGISKWSDKSPIYLTDTMEPDPPENLTITQNQNTFVITWDEPQKWNGVKQSYILQVKYRNLNYIPMYGCVENKHKDKIYELGYDKSDYVYKDIIEPASNYTISISAKSSDQIGSSIEKNINSTEADPAKPYIISHTVIENSIKNKYNVSLYVNWSTPCQVNGFIREYKIQLSSWDGSRNECHNISISSSNLSYNFNFENLLPDTRYKFVVQLHLQSKYSENYIDISSPAGVPDIVETVNIPGPIATPDNPETTAIVSIRKNMFNSSMGEIIYYAIIVAESGCEEEPKSDEYSKGNWPKVVGSKECIDENKIYQATQEKWNPFKENKTHSADDMDYFKQLINEISDFKYFTLGTEKNCTLDICNRPLKPNTNYSIKIRGFTKRGFSDTQLLYFKTASFVDEFQLGLTLGLIFGILAIAFIIAAALFYTKGKLSFTGWPRMESTANISPAPLPVPLKKFKTHYAKMIENSGKIKNEFQLLSTISSDVTLSTKTAILPINRKKNRYINILPYDQTRVKLIDTSITASDYINASYIKGYSEFNEYIATQGPTESTSAAFWQMVIEQNVELIIMLTQFVEAGKEKCHKYFPDLNDSQNYFNVITVECIDEELQSSFNRRIFKITKGKTVKKITHLQFNLWPDFGVPHEIDHIIGFNKIIKDTKMKKPFLVVMHCSAGVGRTGTLIAVDILMQAIRDKRKVDIFGTVLNLRKQRMNMVQSEIQYEFLYQCVDFLLSDTSRTLRSSFTSSTIQLNHIEENHITEIKETFKL